MRVVSEGRSHPRAAAHELEQSADVINHLGASAEVGRRFMESGDCGDLAGEVSAEGVAVAGSAEQTGAGSWVVESAEGLDDPDASPAGDSLGKPEIGKPEKGLDASWPSPESVCPGRPEVFGEQPDRLNQWDVVGFPHGGEQGRPDGDGAPIAPAADHRRPVRRTRSRFARSAAAAMCSFW